MATLCEMRNIVISTRIEEMLLMSRKLFNGNAGGLRFRDQCTSCLSTMRVTWTRYTQRENMLKM